MNSEVMFECDYSYRFPLAAIVFAVPLSLFFLLMSIAVRSIISTLSVLLMIMGAAVSIGHKAAEHECAKIQVCRHEIRVIKRNGTVMRTIALRDVQKISVSGRTDIQVQIRDTESEEGIRTETLCGVTQAEQFTAAALQQIHAIRNRKQAALQHHPTEADTDEINAAQHLLQQGMISEQQFDSMLAQQLGMTQTEE